MGALPPGPRTTTGRPQAGSAALMNDAPRKFSPKVPLGHPRCIRSENEADSKCLGSHTMIHISLTCMIKDMINAIQLIKQIYPLLQKVSKASPSYGLQRSSGAVIKQAESKEALDFAEKKIIKLYSAP